MEFTIKAFEGITKDLVFGINRNEVLKKFISLGIEPYEKGEDREWVEDLDLVIHYSEDGLVDGFEFFMDQSFDMVLMYEGEDLLKKNYEELYSFLVEHDFFVIRFNDSFISFGCGIVVGFNTEKKRNIESIYIMSNKVSYKKTIISQIEEFY